MNIPFIDYSKIAAAIEHYSSRGYQEIAAPWIVSEQSNRITFPQGKVTTVSMGAGHLVGSAEQSFLHLVQNQNLKGRFQATTPCFRDEKETELHYKYFVKTELFCNDIKFYTIGEMLDSAVAFYKKYLNVNVVETAEQEVLFDIVSIDGIELGSYGIRNHPDVGEWVYGTGCAEPRLSQVLKIKDGSREC